MPDKQAPLLFLIFCLVLGSTIVFLMVQNRHLPQSVIVENETLYSHLPPTGSPPQGATTSPYRVLVPILSYHIIRPSYPNDTAAVRDIAHTPDVFDAEMKHLSDTGYHLISFTDLENYFYRGTALPPKPIIISFDDGWQDQFDYAFPILEKYHYTATFFVFTNAIGRPGFLSWDELRTLLSSGMTVASHSRSHPFLTKIADQAILWSEIYDSKKILEQKLGITVNEFAYPFGQYNSAIKALVKKAGYRSARGDYYYGPLQSKSQLYELSTLNAPTTAVGFDQIFR